MVKHQGFRLPDVPELDQLQPGQRIAGLTYVGPTGRRRGASELHKFKLDHGATRLLNRSQLREYVQRWERFGGNA